MDSEILRFYTGVDTDRSNRSFYDIINADDAFWEENHDHIQWVFPLPEPSEAQPQSPVLEERLFSHFSLNLTSRMRMVAALGRFVAFLDRSVEWRAEPNHNQLRITRAIRSLVLAGLSPLAEEFLNYIQDRVSPAVLERSHDFWMEALKR